MNKHNPGIDRDLTFLGIAGLILILISSSASAANCGLVVDNTNLAPSFVGEPPGTGARVNATTYYANSSEIQLLVWAHANLVSETAGVFIYINNTLVMPQSGRPLGGAEEAYRGSPVDIPRYAFYRVEFFNYHHYEWREYPLKNCNKPGIVYLPGFEGGLFIVSIGLLYTIRRMK